MFRPSWHKRKLPNPIVTAEYKDQKPRKPSERGRDPTPKKKRRIPRKSICHPVRSFAVSTYSKDGRSPTSPETAPVRSPKPAGRGERRTSAKHGLDTLCMACFPPSIDRQWSASTEQSVTTILSRNLNRSKGCLLVFLGGSKDRHPDDVGTLAPFSEPRFMVARFRLRRLELQKVSSYSY